MKFFVFFALFSVTFSFAQEKRIIYSHEFNFQGIYGNVGSPFTGNETTFLSPIYYKINIESVKKLKNNKLFGVKYGAGVGIFPLVGFLSFFNELLLAGESANILNLNHSLTVLYGTEKIKWEAGYMGIAADKLLFGSKISYNHGFLVGVKIKNTSQRGILFNVKPNQPASKLFFRMNTGFFVVNRCEDCPPSKSAYQHSLFPTIAFSLGF